MVGVFPREDVRGGELEQELLWPQLRRPSEGGLSTQADLSGAQP